MAQPTINLGNRKTPRSFKNCDAPGRYSLATLVGETILNPGDALVFEQFITGYGEGLDIKIQCYISSNVFDNSEAHVLLELGDGGDGKAQWGVKKENIIDDGFRIYPNQYTFDKGTDRERSTIFVDGSERINSVLSEIRLDRAPFTYNLKTKKNIKSGIHYIDFYMTYYNGKEWILNKERVEFKIRNFFERHNKLISWLAITASILAIIRLALIPALQFLYNHFI
ncbi:hypothetical protein AOA59_28030 [Pseudomonas sp. 2822-15]|uniref:hypothetical protein n=1 Tax=Pseudomonas sp. 2822-15 TaxID=1712677 RepID=UPI000C1572B8|nr:hypothetical protein [Pseudomonas sp. 2822-15]PIB40351.1 hypothetical protein AOA59_28030 [Pseudomonas sp. 2822-15]